MPSCVVKSCKNYLSKLKKSQGITYHAFPRNKNRRDDWVLIIRNCREENNWNPSSASTVCSAHFDDVDFVTTAKGLRCLVPDAIPKRLLSNSPGIQIQSTSTPILQMPSNVRGIANDQQPTTSSSSTISSSLQVPVLTDEFQSTGYCRLCATTICNGMLVNIQSDNDMKKIVVNMSNRLNTNIDFSQEHLPTTICSDCIKSLYMAYDFVVGIDLAQMTLNKIPMQKYQMPVNLNHHNNVDLSNTSLQQTNNGSEACDRDQPWLHVSSETTSSRQLSPKIEVTPNRPRKLRLKDHLHKKRQIIYLQQKNLKRLNQKVRRFRNRIESLKNIVKNLKDRNFISPDLHNTLNENIVADDLFNTFNRKKLKKNITYSHALKKFCLTLNYYSPRAYDYIRQSFNSCLPHRKTLAKWYGHTKGEPGFTEESFQTLKAKAEVS